MILHCSLLLDTSANAVFWSVAMPLLLSPLAVHWPCYSLSQASFSPSLFPQVYRGLGHSLLLALNFFLPSSCSLLFSFPPRPLTKLIPLTHSIAFHQLHKHTQHQTRNSAAQGLPPFSSSFLTSLHLFSPFLSLFVFLNNKLEKWKWGDNCESPFCVPSRASVKFSVWLKASFLWCAVWKLS